MPTPVFFAACEAPAHEKLTDLFALSSLFLCQITVHGQAFSLLSRWAKHCQREKILCACVGFGRLHSNCSRNLAPFSGLYYGNLENVCWSLLFWTSPQSAPASTLTAI